MKFTFMSLLALWSGTTTTTAFAPQTSCRRAFWSATTTPPAGRSYTALASSNLPDLNNDPSLDEEVEQMVQQEVSKSRRMSNLRNEKGVEYAPWMNISPEEETKIRVLMREKATARKRRQEQERDVRGTLSKDSQAQELSGTGLRFMVLDGATAVELEWATADEKSTKGFIVKRRKAKSDDFKTLASYESYGPLASKGKEGGVYRYLDDNLEPGTAWVYRITERESNGAENDLSQCLVELTTPEEQKGARLAAGAFVTLAAAIFAAGVFFDPLQGN